ncbi:MAG: hypothetical protein WCW44_03470 [archaeon]
MNKLVKENLLKNALVVLLLLLCVFPIKNFVETSILASNLGLAGSVLAALSTIAVVACFGNFAFTYEKISKKSSSQRLLAHFTTGAFMFIIGISMIFTSVLLSVIMGYFILVDLTFVLLYFANVGYDFWDLFKAL